jgi:hypothetical protein
VILASFNSETTSAAVVIGALFMVGLLVALYKTRSLLLGVLGGGLGFAVITVCVFATGGGDGDAIAAFFLTPTMAGIGAFMGGISAAIGKWGKRDE